MVTRADARAADDCATLDGSVRAGRTRRPHPGDAVGRALEVSFMTALFDRCFSGFSVDDLDAAQHFYADVLGLRVERDEMGMRILVPGDSGIFVYDKGEAHQPASFTVLNFPVADVTAKVAELTALDVTFERYEGTPAATDDDGVFRGGGPLIAWFTDPAGNVLSVVEAL
jgi:catechol 2,3-dioxygenase-like lactoylglutathione lyase family enzyme